MTFVNVYTWEMHRYLFTIKLICSKYLEERRPGMMYSKSYNNNNKNKNYNKLKFADFPFFIYFLQWIYVWQSIFWFYLWTFYKHFDFLDFVFKFFSLISALITKPKKKLCSNYLLLFIEFSVVFYQFNDNKALLLNITLLISWRQKKIVLNGAGALGWDSFDFLYIIYCQNRDFSLFRIGCFWTYQFTSR